MLDADPSGAAVGPVEGVGAAAMCHGPAAAHASVVGDGGPVDTEQVLDDIAGLCGPGMERNARDFLAHVRMHDGQGDVAYSGVRPIVGTSVA